MTRYLCSICGYVYDEAAGIAEAGIVPGTTWDSLPAGWACPVCRASKDDFNRQAGTSASGRKSISEIHANEMRELGFGELSALFSNLTKGCEKQYRPQEAELFKRLAEYYQGKSKTTPENRFSDLRALIQEDLANGYHNANAQSERVSDRGGLRALTWGEKVTKLMDSILNRYEKQQSALLENTNIFVCEICGFIYLGDEAPEICPVCKVPKMKIQQIQRRA